MPSEATPAASPSLSPAPPLPPPAPTRLRLAVAFGAVYFCWGSTYLGIRLAIETLPPFLMAGVRFLLAGVLLCGWVLLTSRERPEKRHWLSATVTGAFLLLGGNGGVVWAEQMVTSSVTALIVGMSPFWMVILGWLLFSGPRPTLRVVGGLALGFTGIGLLVGPDRLTGSSLHVPPIGAAAIILATVSWTLGSLYARGAAVPRSPVLFTGMQMLTGGAMLLAAGLLSGEPARFDPGAVSVRSGLAFAWLVVFGSLIGFSAYVFVLRHASVAMASTYAYVNPIVAVLLGWLVADEPLTWRMLAAAALIISSVVLISLGRPPRPTS